MDIEEILKQPDLSAGERDFFETILNPPPANEFLISMFRLHGTPKQRAARG